MKTLFPGYMPGRLMQPVLLLAVISCAVLLPSACSVTDERDNRECTRYEEREFEYVVRRCARRQGSGPCEHWERETETRTIRTCVKWQDLPSKKKKSKKQKPEK